MERYMLIKLLVGVELGKMPKLKQLYKCLPVEFSTNIAYDAIDILSSLYTKMAAQGLKLHDGKVLLILPGTPV